jgi:hypothetical protein
LRPRKNTAISGSFLLFGLQFRTCNSLCAREPDDCRTCRFWLR